MRIQSGRLNFEWLPQLLQTNDSFFPGGSYAHSFGLEGMVQLGLIRDRDTLATVMSNQLIPALGHQELPVVRFAHEAALDGDVGRLCALDEKYGTLKGAFELREASSRIGAQRLHMLLRLAPQPLLEELDRKCSAKSFHAHAPVVFGTQAALNKTPLEAALVAYYYQNLVAFVSAAMKLIRLGPEAAQTLLADCLQSSGEIIAKAMAVKEDDLGWFQPTLDIAAARHESTYTRIFIS